jgi:hypothetical protein
MLLYPGHCESTSEPETGGESLALTVNASPLVIPISVTDRSSPRSSGLASLKPIFEGSTLTWDCMASRRVRFVTGWESVSVSYFEEGDGPDAGGMEVERTC